MKDVIAPGPAPAPSRGRPAFFAINRTKHATVTLASACQPKDSPMPFPKFFADLPELDAPFDPAAVTARAIAGPEALAVFFEIHQDTSIAPHSHGDQWGMVIDGELHLKLEGEPRIFHPGESYDIPAGTVHSAFIPAGTRLLDVFAEPDRYKVKRG